MLRAILERPSDFSENLSDLLRVQTHCSRSGSIPPYRGKTAPDRAVSLEVPFFLLAYFVAFGGF